MVHIYSPVSGQSQTLTVGRYAHFSLQLLLRAWKNLTMVSEQCCRPKQISG